MNKRWRLGLYVLADFRELSAPQTPNGTVLPSPLPFGLWKLPNVVFARCQLSTCISDATFSIIVSLKCYRLHNLHKHLCSQQLLKILLRFVLHWTLWQWDWGCNSCPNSTLLQMKFRFNISLSREFSIGCLWLSFESNKSRLSFFFLFLLQGFGWRRGGENELPLRCKKRWCSTLNWSRHKETLKPHTIQPLTESLTNQESKENSCQTHLTFWADVNFHWQMNFREFVQAHW